MQRLEDRHSIALPREIARAGKPRGAGADYRDLLRVGRVVDWFHFFVLRHFPVGREAFQTSDSHRLALLAENAIFLALVFLRADAAANRRQRVRLLDFRDGAVKIPRLDLRDKFGNIDAHGTALTALRHLAGQAALRFGHRRLLVVSQRNLVEIVSANLRVLLRHLMFFQ